MRPAGYSIVYAFSLFATLTLATGSNNALTPIHEAGRCAIRGTCGKDSFFGPELPCSDNGRSRSPTEEVRAQLVDLCGAKWESGPVCCEKEQVCPCSDVDEIDWMEESSY